MQVDEAKKYKEKTELEILKLIENFENNTHLYVARINIDQIAPIYGGIRTYQVKLEVKL